jgi:predicted TIM-barrel fold metal-dependent hydrolase
MRVIAVEEHYQSERILRARGGGSGSDAPRQLDERIVKGLLDLEERRISEMDAAGIDVQLVSLTTPGAQQLGVADAVAVVREENDRLADAVRRHPDRLAALASLPTSAPDAAADELERSVGQLGFKGAVINGTTDGRFIDDRSFWPILERAAALRVPLYLHPAPPPAPVMDAYYRGFSAEVGRVLSTSGWGWHIEAGLHVLRMILAGVFDRFPDLQVATGHLGEALPFMMGRSTVALAPELTKLQRPVAEYIRGNVSFAISGFFFLTPFLSALLEVGADRILFAVDYPYADNRAGRAFLDSLPVSTADREKIAHGNAERLFGI